MTYDPKEFQPKRFDESRPVAVVTGASSGIGRATALRMVADGRQVIGVGRDPGRTVDAAAEIAAAARGGGACVMLRADLSLMAQVARTADEIRSCTSRVDVLINNAGGVRDRRTVTAEGTEATFAANHLAPFLLTRELLPLLRTGAATSPPGMVRVIAVSSSAHRQAGGLDWDDLQSLAVAHSVVAYCRAKLANLLFTRELARREGPSGIVAHAMHPGVVASNFASYAPAAMRAHLDASDAVLPDVAARTLVWLATSAEGGREGGRYFHERAEEAPSEAARDGDAATRLWVESETLLRKLGF
ncbi:SDR family NAD(P)-dependent oxidoreductase [Streptomyces sp. NPDC005373]|uniref:SDR family NAD(P)-dependent oxidoreductase n=1 Tax=Streptomyces sp. NPDC005373 TaxID=3156879 RepID=UPI0033A5905D